MERLETGSWFDDTDTNKNEEKKAVLGLEDVACSYVFVFQCHNTLPK